MPQWKVSLAKRRTEMADPSPSLNPLGLDPDGLLYFGISLMAAWGIVILLCWPKFDESTLPKNEEEFITQLLPRDLVSPKEYSRGLLIYIASMLALVGVISVLGPPVLKNFGVQSTLTVGATPIAVALILVGLAPNVPVFKELEVMLRRFAHVQAFIPAAAKATADRLTVADFNFSQYRNGATSSGEMRGVNVSDFEAQRGSIEYNWARLCCLCYALRARQDQETEQLDRRLLNSYRRDLDSVYERRTNLEVQVVQFRNNPGDDVLRRDLRVKIRDALQKLYVFIGCSTRLSGKSKSQIDQTLGEFGFLLEPVRADEKNGDLMIVGLSIMTASVLVVCFVGSELGKSGLWNPSRYFPVQAIDPFIWALSAFLAHGVSIWAADRVRTALLRKDRWYEGGIGSKGSVANYIRVGTVCALAGYIVLLLCGIVLQPATWGMVKGAAPYALMPAATGAFYAHHIDNAELASRPSRLFEIFPQAACTGFMGFAASEVWIGLGNTPLSQGIDFVILVTVMGLVVGASLAWYIPENAAARSRDPVLEARDIRLREIRALALQQFGNPAQANVWLETSAPSLKGLSPIAALGEARNYEDIIRVLKGSTAR